MTTTSSSSEIEIQLGSPVGPRVLYAEDVDAETVDANVPAGYEVSYSDAVRTDSGRWSAPLVRVAEDGDSDDAEADKAINVDEINSAGIQYEAKKAGVTTATMLEQHGDGDSRITIYELNGVRVADTNGDPVWEEDDPEAFAELLSAARREQS
jgi:hypothetical protein